MITEKLKIIRCYLLVKILNIIRFVAFLGLDRMV